MGISIDASTPERDSSGAWAPAIEAFAHAASGSFGRAVGKGFEAIKGCRVEKPTREQLAWRLWCESLVPTLERFFEIAGLTRRPDSQEIARLICTLLQDSITRLQQESVELKKQHLVDRRCDFPLYRTMRASLPTWIRHVDPEHNKDDNDLRHRLDRSFERGLYEARFDGDSYFDELNSYLCGIGSEHLERWDDWQRYYEWLRREVEDRPLFGQEERGPSLDDIFMPLRCSWSIRNKSGQAASKKSDRKKKKREVHLAWLAETLDNWINIGRRDDALRVVTGGPGCGKSSSARILARDIAQKDQYNVFVVPLQGLDVRPGIKEIVAAYVADASANIDCLPTSPIDWQRNDQKPLLLVFDGLDEVTRPDGAGFEVTRQFLGNLRNWLITVNGAGRGRAHIMAIVLGRPQAAAEAAHEIALDEVCLLRVQPLGSIDFAHFGPDINLLDPQGLASIDQRKEFWDKYTKFESTLAEETPEALNDESLSELTVEPLLLYLLMFSGYAGEKWPEAKENRNRVYEAIFREVHDRDVKKGGYLAKEGITEPEDFFLLMECLGLAAWQNGGRTGTSDDFETIRDKIYIPERAELFSKLESAKLKNVALQFFTHQGGHDREGYAFMHKSFGEYLTARALIAAADRWLARYDGLPDLFAKAWLQLTGPNRQTSDLTQFMFDQARLLAKPSSKLDANWQSARERINALVKVMNKTLDGGSPLTATLH